MSAFAGRNITGNLSCCGRWAEFKSFCRIACNRLTHTEHRGCGPWVAAMD